MATGGEKMRNQTEENRLLTRLGKDRAAVTLHDLNDVRSKQTAIVELVNRWVVA
jgi:hypothetical protein